MTALITLSHGSRHPAAAPHVEALTRAAGLLAGVAAMAAHLEFNEPTLESATQELAQRGVRDAVVVPLLFTEGYHQRVDVPAAIVSASASSGLVLRRARGLGTGEDMAQLLAAQVPAGSDKVVVYSVGSSDEQANDAVANLARRVGELTGCDAEVAYATRDARDARAAHASRSENRNREAGRIASSSHSEVVVPLFVSPGLLLDRLASHSDNPSNPQHRKVLPPLGESLADIVSRRFQEVAHA
ncbi:sirohydrochlorin chelatase [Corynebacterium minutissimum]|uniref:Sirohydrochlorin ferrochelatase n=1 Tax=Corynebacterium minutissimum TaxID=38301 RepID=A0A376CV01_9CORY|nr:sirohydrochlorin chelatase [Corynebacterium minutissimum]QRP60371.1 sirohydrochlorin chelatase [Corynebacterium minutissimum]STC75522.1 sirohydrochlorin ferrochelatase [Corynebacterium minutissimum]